MAPGPNPVRPVPVEIRARPFCKKVPAFFPNHEMVRWTLCINSSQSGSYPKSVPRSSRHPRLPSPPPLVVVPLRLPSPPFLSASPRRQGRSSRCRFLLAATSRRPCIGPSASPSTGARRRRRTGPPPAGYRRQPARPSRRLDRNRRFFFCFFVKIFVWIL
jgi:hypothetical protein